MPRHRRGQQLIEVPASALRPERVRLREPTRRVLFTGHQASWRGGTVGMRLAGDRVFLTGTGVTQHRVGGIPDGQPGEGAASWAT